jgi:sulfatase maturation enzyme AslB (radical SAM superfamily)
MEALSREHATFQFGLASTIFAANLEDAGNVLAWAKAKKLDIVFNMLRFTDAMLNNKELESQIGFHEREEAFMREFFLERVQEESILTGQAFLYLHYAEMIANGYHRTMPCPFQTQGLLLNPYGDLYFCENSEPIGNVLNGPAEELYFKAESQAHRADLKDRVCPTCLSPCQVNVGAMKQVVPYLQFLVRAYRVKHGPEHRLHGAPAAH